MMKDCIGLMQFDTISSQQSTVVFSRPYLIRSRLCYSVASVCRRL